MMQKHNKWKIGTGMTWKIITERKYKHKKRREFTLIITQHLPTYNTFITMHKLYRKNENQMRKEYQKITCIKKN